LDSARLIERLQLTPHPEGGFYKEVFRDLARVRFADGRERSAGTTIYYHLPEGTFSAFHRLRATEIWHRYGGGALRLHMLGLDSLVLDEANPQAVVPANTWQAAELVGPGVLCGCTVFPGFELEDFELAGPEALLRQFPEQRATIERLARR
jgi:hypothetical protein